MKEILGPKYKNDYIIVNCVEENNFNKIYRAHNNISGQNCFLKVINKKQLELGDYDFLLEQTQREIEITKLCNSKNTINLYRNYEVLDNIILELEPCEKDLKAYIKNNGELKRDKPFFKQVIKDLSNALKIIHSKGVMHRDIKPYNFFIKNLSDEIKIIKLGDFGCSTYIKDNTSEPLGTILYTAPEIIKNYPYDEKCDLWSLGVSLYELYFGFLPFGIDTTPFIIKKAIYDEENFTFKKTNIPTLDTLFKRLLVINPDNRMTFNEFFAFVDNPNFMEDMNQADGKELKNEDKFKLFESILEYNPEGLDKKKIHSKCVKKILTYIEGEHLPDIMSFPNGKIDKEEGYNNIIYYDENINNLNSINKDSDYFERQTPGAFILCTNLESLKLVREEILRKIKKDKRITFNLITTGSTCKKVMDFIMENKHFYNCILNVCIYCFRKEKYLYLANEYRKIHGHIYNRQSHIINFIKTFSKKEIKPFPVTKLITLDDYREKYKDRHFKISQFYGDLTEEKYKKYYEKMKKVIEKEFKWNHEKDVISDAFCKFSLEKDLKELDKLIIKEYTKNTFQGDLNRWLMNSKMNFYEPVAYFTARLMYSLNSYAFDHSKFCLENEKVLYRGVQMTYTNLLPYERAKGKIILLSAFTSSSEKGNIAYLYSGRKRVDVIYKNNLKFSVIFEIKNIFKNGWISSGIDIHEESQYHGEKEILFQPFTFYFIRDVKIDIKHHTADIFLETIGKVEILEEKIKYNLEIEYNGKKNIMEINI